VGSKFAHTHVLEPLPRLSASCALGFQERCENDQIMFSALASSYAALDPQNFSLYAVAHVLVLQAMRRVGQNHKYIRCIHGTLGR